MKQIIEKIKSKFGMSAILEINIDGSGHIKVGVFDPNSDKDYEYIHFQSIQELENILNAQAEKKNPLVDWNIKFLD